MAARDAPRARAPAAPSAVRTVLDAVTRATGITPIGLILIGTAILSWSIGRWVAGMPLYLFAYGLIGVVLVSLALGRRPLPLEGRRSDTRPRLREGEQVDMSVVLTSTRRITTFILEEKVPAALGEPARAAISALAPGEAAEHSYQLTCQRRGVYQLGPLVARWGDPFGLTQREVVLQEPFELLVHPATELVSDRPLTRLFEDPPIRPPVSRPWPHGMEFYGMREYAPGDDVRKVVWRAFARTGRLLIREAEQGITDKITLIVDNRRRSHSKGEPSESFEAAIRAAASLGVRHLREGYSVTLELNEKRAVGPLRTAGAQLSLLDALARASLGTESVTEPIMRLVGNPSRDSHVVLLTPLLDREAAGRLQLLVQRGTSVLVAACIWDDEHEATLAAAAALGCQVIEIRPGVPLATAFRREVGAGRL
jgi:uncharacterized protein (DUF58 family)